MNAPSDYRAFLEGKMRLASSEGFEVPASMINPALAPHCRAIVPWACRGGRRGVFASFGLHKTSIQLEIARQVLRLIGGPVLIVLPLGVRQIDIGMGRWVRDRHELLLIGKLGNPPCPMPGTQPESIFRVRRGRHSEKPFIVRDTITAMFPGLPKIELFGRVPSDELPGLIPLDDWEVWGNQAVSRETA